jgi:hypothetical protein
MAFCTRCGAPVSGKFCGKCGTPMTVSEPAAVPPIPAVPPVPSSSPVNIPGTPATPKKRGPWLWVLAGCFGLVLIAGAVVVGTGFFVAYKARQAGLDPDLMRTNPGLAVAKMMATANPDIEVLSVDENQGIVKVREKKTGKTLTMNLSDVKSGKIVFQDDQGQTVEMNAKGEGENASVEIRGPKGSMRIGEGAGKLPDWLPGYPGSEATGRVAFQDEEANGGSITFTTGDSVDRVASFYEETLKSRGFEVNRIASGTTAQSGPTMLVAKDPTSERTAQITIAGSGEGTTVSVIFSAGAPK